MSRAGELLRVVRLLEAGVLDDVACVRGVQESHVAGEEADVETRPDVSRKKTRSPRCSDSRETAAPLPNWPVADFDAAWRELMDGHRPTRAIVEAGLAWAKLLVEVQAVAYVGTDTD